MRQSADHRSDVMATPLGCQSQSSIFMYEQTDMKNPEPIGDIADTEGLPRTLTAEEYRLILGFHRDAIVPVEVDLSKSQVSIRNCEDEGWRNA
jgi:hypothetical protein